MQENGKEETSGSGCGSEVEAVAPLSISARGCLSARAQAAGLRSALDLGDQFASVRWAAPAAGRFGAGATARRRAFHRAGMTASTSAMRSKRCTEPT